MSFILVDSNENIGNIYKRPHQKVNATYDTIAKARKAADRLNTYQKAHETHNIIYVAIDEDDYATRYSTGARWKNVYPTYKEAVFASLNRIYYE